MGTKSKKSLRKKYESKHIKLTVSPTNEIVSLHFFVPENKVSTSSFPHTHSYLQKKYPRVLKTKCFNPKNLSFSREVRCTEMAHLFEHILLDLIVTAKHHHCQQDVILSGVTTWDWTKEKKGAFHIELNLPSNDHHYLATSLPQALDLIENLFAHV